MLDLTNFMVGDTPHQNWDNHSCGGTKKIRQNQTVHELKIVFHNGKKRDVLGKSWKMGF